MGKYSGKSKLALRPKSTEQVSRILAYCNDRRLAIVPQASMLWPANVRKSCRRQASSAILYGVALTPEMPCAGG